ncbi:pilus (MSHA type) biogenesis protein MshL [Helicobacter himalayensis]|uniref:pilus (MSHA type) biogenesis protein MshL n=1 Tax=Helicobacter himalayensis TaxID=1591088 RepID=UPI00082DBB7B|nr:pilus (MSHA type) biogenesis protein MshL [Helicobacter himalayensis]
MFKNKFFFNYTSQVLLLCSPLFTCENITLNAYALPSQILEEIARECKMSLVYLQDSKKHLDSKKLQIRLQQAPLQNALEVVFAQNDLHYDLKENILYVSTLQTKTFSINYISTARVGSSNTDVFFSQDSQGSLLFNQNPYTTGMGAFGWEDNSQAHKMALNKAASHTLGNGKSGTKIYSIDEMDFWGELENEIYNIAYRPGDWYLPDSQNTKDFNRKDIIINKGAGLLTITGSKNQIERVEHYLQTLKQKIHSQVLIDVNIFNIEHSNVQTNGVDWEQFFGLFSFATTPLDSENASSLVLGSAGNSYGINVFSQGVSIERIVEFLQTYGKVESLSNPRVLTLNNQPAIISVGSVLRYQQSTTFQTTTQGTSIQNAAESFPSVFAGILLDVTPSIENNRVILKINPSITKTKDNAVESQTTALSSPPNLSTKQLSSLVALENGQKIVLGGLIDKTQIKQTKKLPILGDIPLLKYLFSYNKNTQLTKEMVIIITPSIINPTNSAQSFSANSTQRALFEKAEDSMQSALAEFNEDMTEIDFVQ